jgi:hypothetical protein
MNLVTIYDIQNKFVGMFACVFLLYIVNFKELIELPVKLQCTRNLSGTV